MAFTALDQTLIVVQKAVRADSFGIPVADNFLVLGYLGGILDLGGSDDVAVPAISPQDWQAVRGYRDYSLNGDTLGGLTLDVVAYSRAEGASPADPIQWRLRNTTDGSNAALGDSHSDTDIAKQVKTVTLASGAKDYRLELLGDGYAYGYLRFRKVPS